MRYEEFIHEVQERAGLESRDEAVRTAEVVLKTLSERLTRQEREDLASQLPKELKDYLYTRHGTEHFLLEEFYNRVSNRADIGYPHAVVRSQAVACTLRDAIATGEIRHILSSLPPDFNELFGKKPESPLSPTSLTAKESKRVEGSGTQLCES